MREQVTKLLGQQGFRAFEVPRSSAIAHETGHVVVGRYHGFEARSCEITPHAISCEIVRRAVNSSSAWGGFTKWAQPHPFEPEGPVEFTTIATPTVLAQMSTTIAGVVAEAVFDPAGYRDGSSIDEVLVAQVLVDQLAPRLGQLPETLWDICCPRTAVILQFNERPARAVMKKLDAAGIVRRKQLAKLTTNVHKLNADPFDWIAARDGGSA